MSHTVNSLNAHDHKSSTVNSFYCSNKSLLIAFLFSHFQHRYAKPSLTINNLTPINTPKNDVSDGPVIKVYRTGKTTRVYQFGKHELFYSSDRIGLELVEFFRIL